MSNFNPFRNNPPRPKNNRFSNSQPENGDPLDIEDLLVNGTAKAKVMPDGRIVHSREGHQVEGGTNLLKDRVWGCA
ncbi:MAG TPA: hypothetical protein PLU72_19195 [Candidatus Ozemobacteraceae bacterium]|nr:hypothetical protein [Candidatus Ozemobacteraceae bacterium]HQG27336.1 hypothetical protein [Candidatus Ozemobacteraceae bacterium]